MKDYSIYELNKIHNYMMQMRPVMKKSALFSDGTGEYRIPMEPKAHDKVTIRFRSAKNNVDMVWLCDGERRYEMRKESTEGAFDYYSAEIQLADEDFSYYFEVGTGLLRCYFDRYGVTKDVRRQYDFKIVPGFSTPDWAKGAVMYQILVDRFYNGDKTNDVENDEYFYIRTGSRKMSSWVAGASDFSVAEFYGGDLEGVRQKLDYLADLGIEVIYFNPIFVSPSNHKYDCQDYDYIDPHLGKIVEDGGSPLPPGCTDNRMATKYQKRVVNKKNLEASNELFATLVKEAHERGIRVILDGVFNHCGSFNKWLDREQLYESSEEFETGAYISGDSKYKDFFRFQENTVWPNNRTYEGWWGHDTLPKLNYEGSEELCNYILEVGKKWVSPPYNADGWRLDVAADLGHSAEFNHAFWKRFREAVKTANPEAIILAEHYGDAKPWLSGDEWDTIMNYSAFMEPVTWFLTGMEKHSESYDGSQIGNASNFEGAMRHYMTNFLTPSLMCSMNQLSNHDHSRFLTRTNHKVGRVTQFGYDAASEGVSKAVFKEAVVMLMTWPGAPTLYYGDEAGVCGFTDPDNRRTYPWGREDLELLQFHKDVIRIHKEYEALKKGSYIMLHGEQDVLAYARFGKDEQVVVIVHNGDGQKDLRIPVWSGEVPMDCEMDRVLVTTNDSYSLQPIRYQVKDGNLDIHMTDKSAVILVHKNK